MATSAPSASARLRAFVALLTLGASVAVPLHAARAATKAAEEEVVAEGAVAGAGESAKAADPGADAADPGLGVADGGAAMQNEGDAPAAGGDALDEAEAQNKAEVDSRHTVGEQPELTVVPIHNAAGRAFDLAVGRHVMEGLVGVTHLTPLPATRAAIAKLHPGPQELHTPPALTKLGSRMRSNYVLVVEAMGASKPTHVFIGLVEVKTGTTLLAYRARMPHGTLTAELGLDLSARVRSALRHPAQLRRAAQARAAANADRAARAKVAPEPAAAEGVAPAEEAPAEAEADEKASKKDRKRAKAISDDASAERAVSADDELPHAMLDWGRAWVRLPQMTQRISRLNVAPVGGATAPCYCGSPNNANPFFPMFGFGGEIFSGTFTKQRRRLQDNVGLRVDFGFAPVRSYVTGGSKATISSLVMQVEADVLWRLLWMPHRALSPDATVAIGMAYYAFPLKKAAYPGVAYVAPNFRLDLHFPVHRRVALMAFGAVRPLMTPGGDTRKVLGAPSKGIGLMLGLGLRARWRIFDGELRFRVESYGANFKGQTNLAGTPTSGGTAVQFQNVRLRDSLKEIVLQLGVAF